MFCLAAVLRSDCRELELFVLKDGLPGKDYIPFFIAPYFALKGN